MRPHLKASGISVNNYLWGGSESGRRGENRPRLSFLAYGCTWGSTIRNRIPSGASSARLSRATWRWSHPRGRSGGSPHQHIGFLENVRLARIFLTVYPGEDPVQETLKKISAIGPHVRSKNSLVHPAIREYEGGSGLTPRPPP